MRVLDRHIFASLIAVFFLALASLLLLFFSVLILRYSRVLSEHHQVLSAVVATCFAGIPMHVSFFVPAASAISAFLCLRTWQREGAWLGALASGYGVLRWRRQFLLFALLCASVGWIFTLWLGPYGARIYYARLSDLYADRFFLSTEPKRLVRLTEGVRLWVEEKPTRQSLRNIVLTIEKEDQNIVVAAESGRLMRNEGGLMFEAHNGTIWKVETNLSQYTRFQQLRYGLEGLLNSKQAWQTRWREWTRFEIPTALLIQQIASARSADADAASRQNKGERAWRELVLRLAYPLLSPVYVLAVFALCVPTRPRGIPRWSAAIAFVCLIAYSSVHIYAVTLSERGGWGTISVFVLSAAVLLGAHAWAGRKAVKQV